MTSNDSQSNDSGSRLQQELQTGSANPLLKKYFAKGAVFANRYEIEDHLNTSASSLVFRAKHLNLKKLVVVKVLQPDLQLTEASVESFRREALNVSRISHPNIVKVVDFGVTPIPYLVMDFVEGNTLTKLIGDRLPSADCVNIFLQLTAALNEVHKCGLIHRDLKPSNIMVATGKINEIHTTLIDFGLAKDLLFDPKADVSKTGELVGSLPYMSPEHFSGQRLDERADIYSLGCVMFEVLTGQKVFAANHPYEWIKFHSQVRPQFPQVGQRISKHDRWLRAIVLKMLCKEPSSRYQSMNELNSDLQRLQNKHRPLKIDSDFAQLVQALLNRRSAILLSVLAILITGVLATPATKELIANFIWHHEYDQAVVLLKSGKYKQAASKLAWVAEFSNCFGQGDWRVLESLRKLIEAYDDNADMLQARNIRAHLQTLCGYIPAQLAHRMQTAEHQAEAGQYADANSAIRSVQAIAKEMPQSYLASVTNRCDGYINLLQGHYDRAGILTRKALELQQGLLDKSNPEIGRTLNQLGIISLGDSKAKDAVFYFEAAQTIAQKNFSDNEQEMMPVIYNLGSAQCLSGDSQTGQRTLMEGLKIALKSESLNRLYVALFCVELSQIKMKEELPAEAYSLLKRGIAALDNYRGTSFFRGEWPVSRSFPILPGMLGKLARACMAMNRLEEANSYFEQCIAMKRKLFPTSPSLKEDYLLYAESLHRLNKDAQAQRVMKESLKLERL